MEGLNSFFISLSFPLLSPTYMRETKLLEHPYQTWRSEFQVADDEHETINAYGIE